MVKIAHESPNSLFKDVQAETDIDYFLVHLFEENNRYLRLAQESVATGRETILDNSIFELGEAFDKDKFAFWVEYLRPTWYIIPDVLEDGDQTVQNISDWVLSPHLNNLPGKKIGVVQGKRVEEILHNIFMTAPLVEMVAVSFDYSFYEDEFGFNKYDQWMRGRQRLLQRINEDHEWLLNGKKVHLLGTALPQEVITYKNYDWIYSIDTSNPVIAGLHDVPYETNGLPYKISTKVADIINHDVSERARSLVLHNIEKYRGFWA